MNRKSPFRFHIPSRLAFLAAVLALGSLLSARAQPLTTITPTGWIQDPYSAHNVDFGVINANTAGPTGGATFFL